MKFSVCAIYDEKGGFYARPFFSVNKQVAQRNFLITINDFDSDMSKAPEDYTLFQLGKYDDQTGTFENEKESLGNGVEYIDIELRENIAATKKQADEE